MSSIQSTRYGFYFGNRSDNLCVNGRYEGARFSDLHRKISESVSLEKIVFLKQTHSADVVVFEKTAELPDVKTHLFEKSGDAIITNAKGVGIGVVTADCVPVFLYDPEHHAIAVIHAGWRGLAAKIISHTVTKMQTVYQTKPIELIAHIGPAAGVCCYEVQSDFEANFQDAKKHNLIFRKNDKRYFDPIKKAQIELLENGILQNHIDLQHHQCTICHEKYCSYRREREMAGRQPSLIYLGD